MINKLKAPFLKDSKGHRGQMAIFIVLIFQVLFVLFAMVINIGLIIHDKINLQNAVDLAAYYAAQRQAELLNVMAHQNYQIRQSWKLLAFRYRGFGTLGQDNSGSAPANPNRSGDHSEDAYFGDNNVPTICIYIRPTWLDAPKDENPCKDRNFSIPPLKIPQNLAPWGGFNATIISAAKRLKEQFDTACANRGGLNWLYAMRILTSYRVDQNNRKQLIWSLAKNLSQKNFIELSGEPVFNGVKKTLLKNLTFMNRGEQDSEGGGGEDRVQVEFLNSMEGVSPLDWLPPIHINPTLMYTDIKQGQGCHADPKSVYDLPERGDSVFSILSDQTEVATFKGYAQTHENMLPIEHRMSLGLEKNPWYMSYVGVKARTKPRQIFFPFGPTITLEARAFAKPFGGRMGPWFQSSWPRGNKESTGEKIDKLTPFRDSGLLQLNADQASARLPNYSRFPGDKLGLDSKLALTAVKNLLHANHNIDFYSNIFSEITSGGFNDVMAADANNPANPNANGIRLKEMAAIAPDLFDVTYYSIQPEYNMKYLKLLQAHRNDLGIDGGLVIRGDLGSHDKNNTFVNISDHIKAVNQNVNPWSFYHVKDKNELLTGWVSRGHVDYEFPDNAFQECRFYDDKNPEVKTGGSCVTGGRVGYSVKLVSRNHLNDSIENLGGQGLSGVIENPPSKFDW